MTGTVHIYGQEGCTDHMYHNGCEMALHIYYIYHNACRLNRPVWRKQSSNQTCVGFNLCSTATFSNPLPDNKILDWSKLKQIADDIFKVHLK